MCARIDCKNIVCSRILKANSFESAKYFTCFSEISNIGLKTSKVAYIFEYIIMKLNNNEIEIETF